VIYQVIPSSAAQRDLKKLSPRVRQTVFNIHLPKIATEPRSAGEPLHGDLKGFWSYHFGHSPEYRILYALDDEAVKVLIVFIGTRENAYEEAHRRLT